MTEDRGLRSLKGGGKGKSKKVRDQKLKGKPNKAIETHQGLDVFLKRFLCGP